MLNKIFGYEQIEPDVSIRWLNSLDSDSSELFSSILNWPKDELPYSTDASALKTTRKILNLQIKHLISLNQSGLKF